ncbi:hypothetical protein C1J03_00125 [Sulfitobacter sp. SK012]|uniref:hypothetical protein n=1 Tax=Sulfitobacter sp. SK012 TaxID=1389005 RepID=UPI000E0B1ECB|nr:hypothetical protein [Sulfitobacter sp. SK012]AXI44572.1 hypothetical protein C1J03_00125 [Sulfitobacter sp. SK012]
MSGLHPKYRFLHFSVSAVLSMEATSRCILTGCLIGIVPFLVADMLDSNSGDCQTGDDWTSITVTNGKLVTAKTRLLPNWRHINC